MSKRSTYGDSSDDASSDEYRPKVKRKKQVEFEPVRICSISGVIKYVPNPLQKDIETRVLKAQHYKLCERFRQKEKLRLKLEKRVEELEGRQAKDDEVAGIINRYWNRLDEDARLLLERFDAEALSELGSRDETDEETKHFLAALSNWSVDEVDENLRRRVEFSCRALAKLVEGFDKLVRRNSHLCDLILGKAASPPSSTDLSASPATSGVPVMEEELRKYATDALNENVRIQRLITQLQAENHTLSIQAAHYDDQIGAMENRVETYSNRMADLKYELTKAQMREEKLDCRLAEYVRKEQTLAGQSLLPKATQQPASSGIGAPQENGISEGDLADVTKSKLEELQQELETQTELASNRLAEIQEMNEKNKTLVAELESAQIRTKCMPAELVKSSPDFLALQTNHSCLLEDCRLMKQEIEDLKHQLAAQKQTHSKQIDKLKTEENSGRERTQESILELERQLNSFKKDYDALCLDVEQTNAAALQAGPLNDHLVGQIATLKAQNAQLKLDCRKELEQERKINNDNYLIIKLEEKTPEITSPTHAQLPQNNAANESDMCSKGAMTSQAMGKETGSQPVKLEPPSSEPATACKGGPSAITDAGLKNDIDGAVEVARLRLERDKLEEKVRAMTIVDRKERVRYYADQARLKIRLLEEDVTKLQKELKSAKQEEDGLMNEIESTGQAFEEMQEQNQRLLLQLKEVEETNWKMINERMKDSHVQKRLREEREMQEQMISSLDNKIAAKSILLEKMEDKLNALRDNKTHLENELRLRDQANESLRRKVLESTHSANDLRLRLERTSSQFNELQENVTKKSAIYEGSFMKIKRLEEDKRNLKRQLARLKEMEKFDNIDQLLQEENRQLRETLKCPSCKTRPKNAILTKCYHVFCFDCIKLRYDTRRRKCPECNCRFGANDFRRVYIQ